MSALPAVSPHDRPVPNVSDAFSPALMMEVELTEPLPAVSYDGQYHRAWVLGRCTASRSARASSGWMRQGWLPDSSPRCSGRNCANRWLTVSPRLACPSRTR